MSARGLLPLLCTALALVSVSAAGASSAGPNGRIAFASNRDGNSELYSVNPDGGAERRLTWTMQMEQSPAWSPDGGRIAYERGSGGRLRIWVMNADGSAQTQVSPPAGDLADDVDAAWSPDGTQIAFASTRAGTWNLWVMNADGSMLRRLSDVFASDPAWSPDGQQLAYVGMDGIGVVGADGSNPHVVSAPGAFASGPSWSPDGGQIAFSRNNASGYPGELYVASVGDSGERQLTSDGFENARPSWSPDGTQIVFQRTSTAPFEWSLWAIGTDGTGLRQITSDGNDLSPEWGSSLLVPEPSPPEAPTIEIYSPADGSSYVPGMDLAAFYTCSSAVSYIVRCEGDVDLGAQVELSPSGTRTFTVRAADADGRTAVQSVTYEVVDIVPPQIQLRAPKDGFTYDLGADATIDYSCDDPNGTGVAFCEGDRPSGAPLETAQAGTHTFTVYAVDNAGNFSQATATYTVLDRRPPTIVIASPQDDATYALGSTVLAAYSCRGASGASVLTCTGTVPNGGALDTRSVGTKIFTVRASDENGKTATLTHTYKVIYTLSGFDSPVSESGSIEDAKAGEAIPLKFSLQGDMGLNVVTATTWQAVSCSDWSGLAAGTTGQGRLSYNASNDRYLDLLATDPSWKGSCRTVTLELADGTHQTVRVQFTH